GITRRLRRSRRTSLSLLFLAPGGAGVGPCEDHAMTLERYVERLFETLVAGDRPAARSLVQEMSEAGIEPVELIGDVYWPTYEQIERLHRHDQLSKMAHHLATRLLRA